MFGWSKAAVPPGYTLAGSPRHAVMEAKGPRLHPATSNPFLHHFQSIIQDYSVIFYGSLKKPPGIEL
jgi:hypothetical protein